jgi:hypothetical protein
MVHVSAVSLKTRDHIMHDLLLQPSPPVKLQCSECLGQVRSTGRAASQLQVASVVAPAPLHTQLVNAVMKLLGNLRAEHRYSATSSHSTPVMAIVGPRRGSGISSQKHKNNVLGLQMLLRHGSQLLIALRRRRYHHGGSRHWPFLSSFSGNLLRSH